MKLDGFTPPAAFEIRECINAVFQFRSNPRTGLKLKLPRTAVRPSDSLGSTPVLFSRDPDEKYLSASPPPDTLTLPSRREPFLSHGSRRKYGTGSGANGCISLKPCWYSV